LFICSFKPRKPYPKANLKKLTGQWSFIGYCILGKFQFSGFDIALYSFVRPADHNPTIELPKMSKVKNKTPKPTIPKKIAVSKLPIQKGFDHPLDFSVE